MRVWTLTLIPLILVGTASARESRFLGYGTLSVAHPELDSGTSVSRPEPGPVLLRWSSVLYALPFVVFLLARFAYFPLPRNICRYKVINENLRRVYNLD